MKKENMNDEREGKITLDGFIEQLPTMLRVRRAYRKIHQKQAAKEIGINESTLCRIEKYDGYSVPAFIKCAKWLGFKYLMD